MTDGPIRPYRLRLMVNGAEFQHIDIAEGEFGPAMAELERIQLGLRQLSWIEVKNVYSEAWAASRSVGSC